MNTTPYGSPSGSSSGSDERELSVVIGEDGGLSFVHDDDAYALLAPVFPQLQTVRASHVEPDGSGGWVVDLAPAWNRVNPEDQRDSYVLGPYPRRDVALAAERRFVEALLRGEKL